MAPLDDKIREFLDAQTETYEESRKVGKRNTVLGGTGLAGLALWTWQLFQGVEVKQDSGFAKLTASQERIAEAVVELRISSERNARAYLEIAELRQALHGHDSGDGHKSVVARLAGYEVQFAEILRRLEKLEAK